MASAHCLVSRPDLHTSNPRKTFMVQGSPSSTKITTSSFLPLAIASSLPIKACKISFFSRRSRKFAFKARENLPDSEATLAADAFSEFKHMLLPVIDRNPYLSEGTRQAAATTAALAKKYGADITVVVIDENPKESLPEHSTHLSSIRWHLSEGGFQEFRLIERLGSGSKPTAIIVFDYVKRQHNTVEVTEDTFRSCDDSRSGSVLASYVSGHDEVILTEARKYWFICSISGHCLGGMKFGIDVNLPPITGAGSNEITPIPTPTGGDQPSKSTSLHPVIIGNGVNLGLLHFVLVLLHLL